MKMLALTMVGPRDEMEPVARQMILSGGFQPIPVDYLVNDRGLRSRLTTESGNPYDELLAKMSMVWKAAGEDLPEPKPVRIARGFSMSAISESVRKTAGDLEQLGETREALSEDLQRLRAMREYVQALDAIGMSSSDLVNTSYLKAHFGRVTTDNYVRLTESTEGAPIMAIELSRSKEYVWALVFTASGYSEAAGKIMESVYFREYSLAEAAESLSKDSPLAGIDADIEKKSVEMREIEQSASKILAERRQEYEKLYSTLYTMQRVHDLCKGRGEVGGMFILSGWIPEDTYGKIKETIETEAPSCKVIVEKVSEMQAANVRIPTMLSNNRLVRAFQDVVAMYSVPAYGEVDPSPFVALTFILFFGFMFGDIGHGLLLFLGAWGLNRKGTLSDSLAFVMKCASVSSMIFGALYGSIMGVEEVIPALWLSPMHDTGLLFGTSILAGVIMISVGMVLNMVMKYRERDYGKMLFDGQGLAGLLVYWGAAVAIFISVIGIEIPFPTSYIWYGVVALLVVTIFRDLLARIILRQQPHEKVSGTMQAFEVLHNLMNYFTNTASFVRLAAFALNHVALSFAVMLISNMMMNFPAGIALKGLILVIGNLFIVGLEGLVVFIQVLRLEYYEFFSKFYKGGGNAFKPVQWRGGRAAQTK